MAEGRKTGKARTGRALEGLSDGERTQAGRVRDRRTQAAFFAIVSLMRWLSRSGVKGLMT